jgi:branched-chain amino acid transport system substrate-binding protein
MRVLFAPFALMAVVLAACSSHGASGSSATGGSSKSSNPIKVMTIAPINVPPGSGLPFPEIGDAAQGAVKAINAAGGIKGRQISLTVCDTKYNEDTAAACGRRAVDEGFDAVVGGMSLQTSQIPVLEQGGVALIGSYSVAPPDFKSTTAFPLISGAYNTYGCAAELVDVAKAKNIAIISLSTPQTESPAFKAGLAKVLTMRGAKLGSYNTYTPAPDLSPVVSKGLTSSIDGVFISGGTADTDKLTQIIRQLQPNVAIARTSVSPSSLNTLGSLADNLYVCDSYKPASFTSDPHVKQAVDEIKAVDKNATLDSYAMNTWAAMQVFKQLVTPLPNVDRASILAAAKSATSVDTLIGAKLNFTRPQHAAELGLPYVYGFQWSYNQVKNGTIMSLNDGKLTDPLG